MSKSSKIGVVATAISAALLVAGCASQGSSAATPANVPNSCSATTQNVCKGKASCKATHKKHYKKTVATQTTNADGNDSGSSTTTTESTTESK